VDSEHVFLSATLDSGVQVVGQPMEGVQSAALGFLVGTGARDEAPEQAGISHLTEQMLFRGTEHLDARALSDRFDSLGISYDSSAGLEMTLVNAVMLGDRLPAAVDLLADVVRFPSFPAEAVESARTLILQEIRQREDQPAQVVMDRVRRTFFAGSPLANDGLGTEETVTSLTRDDLVTYWSDRYTANNLLISVAGNFSWEPLLDQLTRITAGWSTGRGRMLMHEPAPAAGTVIIAREMAQENVAFAFPGVPVTDPHYYAAALFSQAMGGSSNSRLFQEVREKRGLAYAVQSRFDAYETAGMLRVYAGTSADRAHETVEVVMEEMGKAERAGIDAEELALSRTRLKSQIVMRSESTSARMVANLRSWWFEGRLRSLEEIRQRIDAVTLEEIEALVQSLHLTETVAVAALGPRSEEELFGRSLART
jgi:predicted Zn-dependent peptidase